MFTTSALVSRSYDTTAAYLGNAANLGSTSPVLDQAVNLATTTAAISSSTNPSLAGRPVTSTATITSASVTPRGTVSFKLGGSLLGAVQLSAGKARLKVLSLPAGSDAITVNYPGDSNIAGSTASLTQNVQN